MELHVALPLCYITFSIRIECDISRLKAIKMQIEHKTHEAFGLTQHFALFVFVLCLILTLSLSLSCSLHATLNVQVCTSIHFFHSLTNSIICMNTDAVVFWVAGYIRLLFHRTEQMSKMRCSTDDEYSTTTSNSSQSTTCKFKCWKLLTIILSFVFFFLIIQLHTIVWSPNLMRCIHKRFYRAQIEVLIFASIIIYKRSTYASPKRKTEKKKYWNPSFLFSVLYIHRVFSVCFFLYLTFNLCGNFL